MAALLNADRLTGVHTKLCQIVRAAAELEGPALVVVEGVRSMARQRELFQMGKSRTLNSRHLTGHAVDLCPEYFGKDHWEPSDFLPIKDRMFQAAKTLGFVVEWGGELWAPHFIDMPHFQIPIVE